MRGYVVLIALLLAIFHAQCLSLCASLPCQDAPASAPPCHQHSAPQPVSKPGCAAGSVLAATGKTTADVPIFLFAARIEAISVPASSIPPSERRIPEAGFRDPAAPSILRV